MTGTVGRGLILKTGLVPGNGFEGLQQGRGDIAILAQNAFGDHAPKFDWEAELQQDRVDFAGEDYLDPDTLRAAIAASRI